MDAVPTDSRRVPSTSWPSLASALASATDGTHIEVLSNYREVITEPFILDHSICIEGPLDCSATLIGEEGFVIAGNMAANSVVLRRLQLYLQTAPAVLVAGGCLIESCTIVGADLGIEVTARSGSAVHLLNNVVRNCGTGISLSGGAAAALAGTRVEHCTDAVVITGLDVKEGWNEVFGTVEGVTFEGNTGANLTLRGWSITEKSGAVRLAPPGEEITVRGWPREACNVVAPTDNGPVILHFTGSKVNTILFEDEFAAEDDDEDVSPPSPGTTFTFEPGSIGIAYNGASVTKIAEGSQAERKGVKVGWRIIAVEGVSCDSFGDEKFIHCRDGSDPYQVTFKDTQAYDSKNFQMDVSPEESLSMETSADP